MDLWPYGALLAQRYGAHASHRYSQCWRYSQLDLLKEDDSLASGVWVGICLHSGHVGLVDGET